MKKYIITSILLIGLQIINAQTNIDCDKFKTGKFKAEGDSETIIRRTKKYQIEKNSKTKIKDEIVWITDCKYKLVPIKVIKDKDGIIKDDILFFEIIETGEGYYVVHVTSDRRDISMDVKVYKI